MTHGTLLHVALAPFVLAVGGRTAFAQCELWRSMPGTNGVVIALTVFDDGVGPALYAGGPFTTAGTASARRIAKWDGQTWSGLGTGMDDAVTVLLGFDDGSGPALYAAGTFRTAGGINADAIARWNGSTWSPVGNGFSGWPGSITALAVFDDGQGAALYAGGFFTLAGGGPGNYVAKWDGTSWLPLGVGPGGFIRALEVFDDGSGSALYAGGGFDSGSGVSRWDGSTWSNVGVGLSAVWALTAFDDGAGAALYAGGSLTPSGGSTAPRVAKWDGATWTPLGEAFNQPITRLAAFRSGPREALHAGGWFIASGSAVTNHVAKWDGSAWVGLGVGTNGTVWALSVYDDGADGEADLYVAGEFSQAGNALAGRIAQWVGCGYPGIPYCFGDGTGAPCPCDPGQVGGPGSGCRHSWGLGARLRASGQALVGADTVTLLATDLPPTAVGLFFQGTLPQVGGTGSPFGDGLLCANGAIRRLGIRAAVGGASSLGEQNPSDPPISVLGAVPPGGGSRYYQLWFRDPPSFCTVSTFNLTNGVRIDWIP